MKRDMDLIRELLLRIETDGNPALVTVPAMPAADAAAVLAHLKLMIDAGLITAIDVGSFDGPGYIQMEMTWAGHEFLEKVRDPEVWSDAKSGAKRLGSWSITLLGELAKAALVAKAKSLGLPIGD